MAATAAYPTIASDATGFAAGTTAGGEVATGGALTGAAGTALSDAATAAGTGILSSSPATGPGAALSTSALSAPVSSGTTNAVSSVGGGGSAAGSAAPISATPQGVAGGDITSYTNAAGQIPGPPAASPLDATATPSATAGAPPGLSNAGTAVGAGTSSNPIASTLSNLGSSALKNPAALVSGAGLLYNILAGDKKPPEAAALSQLAAQDQAQGTQLSSYLTSGTLPSGVQAGLQQAHDAAAATIRSQYAARGQTGSSAEAQDLQNLANTTLANGAQIATGLLNQGIQESEFASQIYGQLMNATIAQDNQLSSSIANFAGALGGYKPITT